MEHSKWVGSDEARRARIIVDVWAKSLCRAALREMDSTDLGNLIRAITAELMKDELSELKEKAWKYDQLNK